MAADVVGIFMCYYECNNTSNRINELLEHVLSVHNTKHTFSIRKAVLDERTGKRVYKAHHFPITIENILQRVSRGYKAYIDENTMKIGFKRRISEDESDGYNLQETQTDNQDIYSILPNVIETLTKMGRLEDFIDTLQAIGKGLLTDNIAFFLLLDVGNFLSQPTIHNVRFSEETLMFWVTVQKLFKGKGINFLRGYQGERIIKDNTVQTKPSDCRINFAVPSDPVLTKYSSQYGCG